MPATVQEKTGLGNYFVANYPPFSAWKPVNVTAAKVALNRPPQPARRSACISTFRFAVNAASSAISASTRIRTRATSKSIRTRCVKEVELYSKLNCVGGRPLGFRLFRRRNALVPERHAAWQPVDAAAEAHAMGSSAAEVTFECEPGTLQQHKLAALKQLGVTRLSLGIENFND